MRLVPTSGSGQLSGLAPSVGAAASLLAAGVTLSLLVASLLGVRVWSSPSDRGEAGSVRLPSTPARTAPAVVRAPEDRPRTAGVRPHQASTPAAAAPRRSAPRKRERSLPAPRVQVAPRTSAPPPIARSAPPPGARSESSAPAAAAPAAATPGATARP